MKKLLLIFFLFLFSFNCFAINFATSNKTYPIWIFQQYNYCKEENIDPNNHNNIVLITSTIQTWPFGIEYDADLPEPEPSNYQNIYISSFIKW